MPGEAEPALALTAVLLLDAPKRKIVRRPACLREETPCRAEMIRGQVLRGAAGLQDRHAFSPGVGVFGLQLTGGTVLSQYLAARAKDVVGRPGIGDLKLSRGTSQCPESTIHFLSSYEASDG